MKNIRKDACVNHETAYKGSYSRCGTRLDAFQSKIGINSSNEQESAKLSSKFTLIKLLVIMFVLPSNDSKYFSMKTIFSYKHAYQVGIFTENLKTGFSGNL